MTEAGLTRILAPPLLVLALAGAIQWWNPVGIQTAMSHALLRLWQGLEPSVAIALRPAAALPAETLALLATSGMAIILILRLRLYWAGLWTAMALTAGFETAWTLFITRHWLIDAATPGLGLVLVFLAGAMARTAQTRALRAWLKAAFFDSLPRAAVEKIIQKPALLRLSGETRTVSYLVCGIPRLVVLAGDYRNKPENFTNLANSVLSPLLDQVLAHGGTIDRISADGFAAIWNAPLDDPDHALHACEAAHAMVAAAHRHAPQLSVGIGVATGPVIAGSFGGRAYGVSGEAALLAARLQHLPLQYGPPVIVSQETKLAAEHGYAFLEVDYVATDTGQEPVKLYAMLGNPRARSSPKFRALSTFHDHIFNALRGQKWVEARGMIEQCRKLSGASQALYDLYLARIRYFEANPPGPEWDGAFRPVLK